MRFEITHRLDRQSAELIADLTDALLTNARLFIQHDTENDMSAQMDALMASLNGLKAKLDAVPKPVPPVPVEPPVATAADLTAAQAMIDDMSTEVDALVAPTPAAG